CLLEAEVWVMTFTESNLQAMLEAIVAFLPRLGLGLLVYLIARWISSWATRLLRRRLAKQKADEELIILLQMLTRWGIQALGIILALEQLAPGRLSTLLAGLGIAGVTIGFALQDVAKNFIAGILLLLTRPFEIGDTIEVNGYTGKVLSINLRFTEMREVDGRFVVIPNTEVYISPIVNFTRAPRRRIKLPLGITFDTDLDLATRATLTAILKLNGVLDDPAPQLVFEAFSDSVIQSVLYYWIDTSQVDYMDAQTEGALAVSQAFKDAGIGMPYPTVEVTLIDNNSQSNTA
ncbi:MAG TPA: mechanosensitive ion channel, partial [Anaerolineales bacterium]|nr:mechanosensitive ion channel [Anaerolineales bacterium]